MTGDVARGYLQQAQHDEQDVGEVLADAVAQMQRKRRGCPVIGEAGARDDRLTGPLVGGFGEREHVVARGCGAQLAGDPTQPTIGRGQGSGRAEGLPVDPTTRGGSPAHAGDPKLGLEVDGMGDVVGLDPVHADCRMRPTPRSPAARASPRVPPIRD